MGHDWIFELVRLAEFRHAAESGQLPPFWAPDLYGGFGSPIFLFYPPLYLTVASVLGGWASVVAGAAAALLLFSLLGAVLTWHFLRRVANTSAARLGVIFLTLQPYFLADKLIRNANAEFAALAIVPGLLLGVTITNRKAAFWWTALSLAGIILAHNLTAMLVLPFALVIGILVHRNFSALLPIVAGIMAALALTAFFWIPALHFLPLVRSADLVTGKFDFHAQFPALRSFVWPGEFYSSGCLTLPFLLALLFAPVRDARLRRIVRVFGLASGLLLLLMLPASGFVWEHVPFLRFAQFPWRLNGPLAVLLSCGAAIAISQLSSSVKWWSVDLLCLALAAANAIPVFHAYQPLPPELRSEAAEFLTPAGIQERRLRATVYDEYLPAIAGPAVIHADSHTKVFRKWAFPVWRGETEGHEVPAENCSGLVCVQTARAGAPASLVLTKPSLRQYCETASVFSGLLLLGLVALQTARRQRSRPRLVSRYRSS